MARPLAVLTGATGFLGGPLAHALSGRGYDLRVLARADRLPAWDGAPPDTVIGRLGDSDALERLVKGAALVVHAAGLIKAPSRKAYFQVNAEGARGLAAAAARYAPDARFLMVSSLSAREPGLSAYAASKAAGEAAVREVLPPGRLTVVRPPAVYGPGDRETLALFKAAARLPALPLPGGPDARVALIHVADAAAQIAAIAGEPPRGAVYTLADARPLGYGWREIMTAAALALGRRPALFRVPRAAVLAAGGLGSVLGRLPGAAPMASLGKARELLHPDWGVQSHELWPSAPPSRFDLASGFADAVSWYRQAGWL